MLQCFGTGRLFCAPLAQECGGLRHYITNYIYIYTVYVNFIVISISRFEMLLVVYGCGLLSGERVLQHVPLIPMLSLLWEFLEHV